MLRTIPIRCTVLPSAWWPARLAGLPVTFTAEAFPAGFIPTFWH